VRAVVGWQQLPASIRAASGLADPTYGDLFAIRTAGHPHADAEAWARTILEQTPTGRSAPRLWRLLGLRLGPSGSSEHVQGWEIVDRAPRHVCLATASWAMRARAVVWVDGEEVALALLVRFERRAAWLFWPGVAVLHRKAVPVMLRQAVRQFEPAA
jgi:hypothetical protein